MGKPADKGHQAGSRYPWRPGPVGPTRADMQGALGEVSREGVCRCRPLLEAASALAAE